MIIKNSEITEILDSFEGYLYEKGRSENTVKTYRGVLHSFFKWLKTYGKSVENLSHQDIQLYIDFLVKEKRSVTTIKKIYNTINSFAKFIEKYELTKGIQLPEIENSEKSPPDFLTKEEIEDLISTMELDGNIRNLAIVYTLLKTGIRVSELCSLNKNDIELNNKSLTGQLVVRNKVDADERTIPLPRSLVHHLKEYVESRTDNEEALFLSNYQKRISVRTVQHTLKQHGVHPHKLRHTFCYELIEKGLDLSIVAQLAGHSDVNITKQYTKLAKNVKKVDMKYA
ncbi:tyrosine-type recombinase/integrase [Evansella sp. AB-rgal1]|uniref:tyrosine-type recombinase/integrase n=1 Tax=Evansella sp. AB-rgal1 TaxID=3242696 RepID=UPI00359CDB3D